MPIPLAIPLITGGISFVSGLFGMSAAKAAEKKAAEEKAAAQRSLDQLINDRQDVINPYEGVTNLSSMLSNPMASLGVATQAAEMKVEEADISLANTLDTVRATGASAGGATALAQAALQSKKGVAASIEAQENRDTAQMDRLSAQISGAEQRESQAASDRTGALTGMIGGLTSIGSSYMSNYAPKMGGDTNQFDVGGFNKTNFNVDTSYTQFGN